MATILHPKAFLRLLSCPYPDKGQLKWEGDRVACQACRRTFPITDDILELVDPAMLDAETSRELRGNTIPLDETSIRKMASKDQWSAFISHMTEKKVRRLARYLNQISASQLISLGSGSGFEIKCLLKMGGNSSRFEAAYCSDLSYSTLCITPRTLEDFDITLGRFTSDLNSCPVAEKRIPVLIYEALHHTQDMHAALGRLMAASYDNIFVVEPLGNFLIRWLAKKGRAQRIEYSGVKPDRLDIKRLRALCKKHRYEMSLTTRWDFPEDYFLRYFGASAFARRTFLLMLDLLSAATNRMRFGNTAIVHLRKFQAR